MLTLRISQNNSPGTCPQELPLGGHPVKYLRDLPFSFVYMCGEKFYFTKSKLEEQYHLPIFKKGSWMEKIILKSPQPPFQNYKPLNIDFALIELMCFFLILCSCLF